MSSRPHAIFVALLLVAAALRLPALGWLPSPAGDEGNWALYGYQILDGETPKLDPLAAFVSLLYARLIAAAVWLFGQGFAAVRAVNALAGVATVAVGYAALAAAGRPRAGLGLAALLAVHPWSVAYSRISSVPYELALLVLLAGCLLFAAGLRRRSALLVAAAVQVLALGAHFSPLTAVGPVVCVVLALAPDHRWVFRRPLVWASVALAAIPVAPIVLSALRIARGAPSQDPFAAFWEHLGSYLHMVLTGMAGEATLRHFTNAALAPKAALALAPLTLGVVLLAATPKARRSTPLGALGPVYFGVSLLVTPILIGPGRPWDLPLNHYDRYLFALLPGFLICAVSAAAASRAGLAAAVALGVWLVGADARLGYTYLFSHGVDRGEGIFDGGSGYRGWYVSDRPVATMERIREVAVGTLGRGGGDVLVADRNFIPLPLFLEGTDIPVHDVRRTWLPNNASGRYLFVLWPDEVLGPRAPPKYVASNRYLRERMEEKFGRVQLVEMLRQRDGTPLLELWLAEMPLKRRLQDVPDDAGSPGSS